MPPWLHTLHVIGWQNEAHETEVPHYTAEMSQMWEYRKATLMIYPPKWRTQEFEYKETTIIHEIVHALMAPVDSFVDNLIENYVEDQPTTDVLTEQYRLMCEGVTEDVAQAVYGTKSRG